MKPRPLHAEKRSWLFLPLNKLSIFISEKRQSMFHYSVLPFRNLFAVLFAIFTRNSITGTSVRTPTVVASAAGEVVPNKAIATATASSKKLDAPIMPAGAAILCGNFKT